MQSVALIDYGSGNLRSAEKALVRAAAGTSQIVVTSDPETVAAADRVVLPGVGAFAACMKALSERPGLIEAMTQAVQTKGRPFLGVCVGMQLLATRGLEFGETPGLGWIPGDVRRVEPTDPAAKIPHMGWNTLHKQREHALLDGIETGPQGLHAYFVHSYALAAEQPQDVLALTDHGVPITAMVAHGNVAGTQFHPEKSQKLGLKLIANFLSWKP